MWGESLQYQCGTFVVQGVKVCSARKVACAKSGEGCVVCGKSSLYRKSYICSGRTGCVFGVRRMSAVSEMSDL